MAEANRTNRDKADALEKIVASLCSDFKNAKVIRNAIIRGKSGTEREIDVLIEATHKSFDIRIVIEAKNYTRKVDIGIVEALKTKLHDVGGNLGVIVCPLGFTEGASNSAKTNDIQLYQVFDRNLGNTTQLIPLRYIVPSIDTYQIRIEHRSAGGGNFVLPTDLSKWRFYINNEILDQQGLLYYSWNQEMFPQKAGEQVASFGVVKIGSVDEIGEFYYLELSLKIRVKEDYYLKLLPASYMKNIVSGKGNHQLYIHAYSKKEDMIKNGWKHFDTKDEMEKAAEPHDTSRDLKKLVITEVYTLETPTEAGRPSPETDLK